MDAPASTPAHLDSLRADTGRQLARLRQDPLDWRVAARGSGCA